MFKSIKENEYVKKFIELWGIPRYRSILILGLYIIFFAFVISAINGSKSYATGNTNKISVIDAYGEMNNYRYQATIKNATTETIVGRVYENKQILSYNQNNYYYNNVNLYQQKGNVYKKTSNQLMEFEIWRFTPSFISELVSKGKFESKTQYADGVVANTYLVRVIDFIKLYFGENESSSDYVNITLYQDSEKIFKVELDLTTIYHQQELANQYDYKVMIEYDMENAISPILVNIESSD